MVNGNPVPVMVPNMQKRPKVMKDANGVALEDVNGEPMWNMIYTEANC